MQVSKFNYVLQLWHFNHFYYAQSVRDFFKYFQNNFILFAPLFDFFILLLFYKKLAKDSVQLEKALEGGGGRY